MGATRRLKDAEYEELSSTEQLFGWIIKMRKKKIKYLRSRKRNIRVEAVLGHALSEAELELRKKQLAKIDRWHELKQKMAEKNKNCTANNKNNGTSKDEQMDCQDGSVKEDNKTVWSADLHPELSSLDNFISQLSSVKAPVIR